MTGKENGGNVDLHVLELNEWNLWNTDITEDAFLHNSLFYCLKKIDTEHWLWLKCCIICKSILKYVPGQVLNPLHGG